MGSARCYECPACGGLVREQARTCTYCASPIATVRCSICFTMNVPDARFCLACGSELGLEPAATREEGQLFCPRCPTRSLDGFSNGDGVLYDCGRCGGQFVEPQTLAVMVRRHQSTLSSHEFPRPRPFEWNRPIEYIPCPVCRAKMMRRNFGRTSGVIVDVCEVHGTWFDVGELPSILWFVASGKLVESAELWRVEKARLATARSELRLTHEGPLGPSQADHSVQDLLDAVAEFVAWAASQVLPRH
jgi:Zn-finger nucleic acid-binding protein